MLSQAEMKLSGGTFGCFRFPRQIFTEYLLYAKYQACALKEI